MNKENIIGVVQVLATLLFLALAFDALAFLTWAYSGQIPPDSFYAGSITAHILAAIY